MHEVILNIISTIIALITSIYLGIVARKCVGKLKRSAHFLSMGILIALAIHAAVEALESFDIIPLGTLLQIMPILVMIGSIFLIIGANLMNKSTSDL